MIFRRGSFISPGDYRVALDSEESVRSTSDHVYWYYLMYTCTQRWELSCKTLITSVSSRSLVKCREMSTCRDTCQFSISLKSCSRLARNRSKDFRSRDRRGWIPREMPGDEHVARHLSIFSIAHCSPLVQILLRYVPLEISQEISEHV